MRFKFNDLHRVILFSPGDEFLDTEVLSKYELNEIIVTVSHAIVFLCPYMISYLLFFHIPEAIR